ncbi:MAG: tetratricopeptide repeat protein [Planctomycetota bacterium]
MKRASSLVALLVLLSACNTSENRIRDFRDHVRTGERKLQNGDAPGAVRAFENALDLEPESASTWFSLGEALRAVGDEKGAARAYARALDLNLDDATRCFRRGKEKQAAGDPAGAVADYTQALSTRTAAEFHRARGHARFCLGDLDGAVADLAEAGRTQNAGANLDFTQLELAAARLRAGRGDEAVEGLKRHFRQARPTMETAWPRQIAEFLQGEFPEQELLLTARTGDEKTRKERTCEATFYAGVAREAAGDDSGALDRFRECVENAVPGFVEPDMARAELKRLAR